MIQQEIKLGGLTNQPSDCAVGAGQLCVAENLINEYGSLVPTSETKAVLELAADADKVYIHKFSSFSHYIIHRTDSQPAWVYVDMEDESHTPHEIAGLDSSLSYNAVVMMGTTACFVADDTTKYAIWRDGAYHVLDRQAFAYSVSLKHIDKVEDACQTLTGDKANCGYIFVNSRQDPNTGAVTGYISKQDSKEVCTTPLDEAFFLSLFDCQREQKDSLVTNLKGTSLTGARNFFAAIDAAVNKWIAKKSTAQEPYLKYVSFGVAAVRLYDGSHIMVSDVFTIAPRQMSNRGFANYLSKYNTISMMTDLYKVSCTAKFNAGVDNVSDLVQGIDIFLSPPQSLLNLDKVYGNVSLILNGTYYRNFGDMTKGENGEDSAKIWSFDYDWIEGEEMQKLFDSMAFYKSICYSVDDLRKSTTRFLVNTSETGEVLSLADMQRFDIGGQCAFVYNDRLHIGNVSKSYISPADCFIEVRPDYVSEDIDNAYINKYVPALFNKPMQTLKDRYGENDAISYKNVMRVATKENLAKSVHFLAFNGTGYIDPVIMFPDAATTELTVFVHKSVYNYSTSVYRHYYYRLNYNLFSSTSKGVAFFVRQQEGQLMWTELTAALANSTEEEFNAALAMCADSGYSPEGNLVKISDPANPFLFSPTSSITAGSGKVMSMAAATKALSQGQFGAYPLYLFTSDGIWAAQVGATGAYTGVRPLSRDVIQLENLASVTQVDNEVLYVSKRGIMMLDGSKVTCISDVLDGNSGIISRLPHLNEVLMAASYPDAFLSSIVPWRTYLQGCRMAHDYYNQRVIVYNPAYQYSYVYSERSGMWGMKDGSYDATLVSYPDSSIIYTVDEDTRVVAEFCAKQDEPDVSDPDGDIPIGESATPYVFITRPCRLNSNFMLNLISRMFVRGVFQQSQMSTAMWASNNLYDWVLVATSAKPFIDGVRGTGYRYYVFGAIGFIEQGMSIHDISVEYQNKYSDRIR